MSYTLHRFKYFFYNPFKKEKRKRSIELNQDPARISPVNPTRTDPLSVLAAQATCLWVFKRGSGSPPVQAPPIFFSFYFDKWHLASKRIQRLKINLIFFASILTLFFFCNITGSTREAQWAWLIKETNPLQAETAALLWAKMENWSRVIFEGLFWCNQRS